jgi:hypothetical protein
MKFGTDPDADPVADPVLFVNDLQDASFLCLFLFEGSTFTSFFNDKKP